MDSLTQFTLGAAVSAFCLGRKLGPRKAALLGGILGTVPDLDVFLPFDNPVDAFVLHRGWTHSLFVHALATPVVGEILVRSIAALRESRARVWLTVFLCFSTHAIIDAMTVYGTRIFWPFYPDPVGVGSIFIIDPLYTVPLLVVVIWAFFSANWSSRFNKGLVAALIFSTAYMGLSVALQAYTESRAKTIFADAGIEARNVFAIAGPFNTIVWKVIGQCRASKVVLNLASKVVMRGKVVELPGAIWKDLEQTSPLCTALELPFLVTKPAKLVPNLRRSPTPCLHLFAPDLNGR